VKCESGDPWFQVALLWQAGQYRSKQDVTLGTGGKVMKMINMLEDGVDSNLQIMVTIPRKLNMQQFQYRVTSE
jgi:hypothetical protein